jgi:alanine dehydrogenase
MRQQRIWREAMRIGVPKEIKNHEYRVGLTPAFGRRTDRMPATRARQTNAGMGIDFADDAYIKAGATIAARCRRGVRGSRT